jgi:hypothetical protein
MGVMTLPGGYRPWGGFPAVLLRKPDHGKMIGDVMLHV